MIKNIYVIAEQRKGSLRDITWEAVAAGKKLATDLGAELTCVLLCGKGGLIAEQLAGEVPKVLLVENPVFESTNSEAVISTLKELIKPQGSY